MTPVETENWSEENFYGKIALLILAWSIAMVAVGFYFNKWLSNKRGLTISTQSQTTYKLNWSTPRFVPLKDSEQGAWYFAM